MGFSTKNRRSLFAIMLTIALTTHLSCKTEYTGQYFSYPPGSQPHENNWEYTAKVIVTSKNTPITDKSKKYVQLMVYDKQKINYLNADFEFISASIAARIEWEKFEEIKVELFEVGNQFAKDSYNINLIKTGPRILLHLTYIYNQEGRRFEKR